MRSVALDAVDAGVGRTARTWIVVGQAGEDAFAILQEFAQQRNLGAGQLTGVGAFARATVGWFDRAAKDYRHIVVDEQCELLSLVGDIARGDEGPQVHAHVVLGLSDGTTRGGHLISAEIWPTLEVIVRQAPIALHKTFDPEFGLALVDPDRHR